MKSKKDTSKKIHIIKIVAAVLVLIGLTVCALELPKLYYRVEDEKLGKQVETSEFALDTEENELSEEQMIAAFYDDETMYIDTKRAFKSWDIIEYESDVLNKLYDGMNSQWLEFLETVLNHKDTKTQMTEVRMVKILDNKIYSANVGIIAFYNPYSMDTPGVIMFDMKSKKLIKINMWAYVNIELATRNLQLDEPNELLSEGYFEYYDPYSGEPFYYIEGSMDENELAVVKNDYIDPEPMYESIDKWFLIDEESKKHISDFSYCDYEYIFINPFQSKNYRTMYDDWSSEYYLDWDYNDCFSFLEDTAMTMMMNLYE